MIGCLAANKLLYAPMLIQFTVAYLPTKLQGTNCHDVMMTSSNENIFRVTGQLCGEFTGDRWIPRTKNSDTEIWCFLWSAPE